MCQFCDAPASSKTPGLGQGGNFRPEYQFYLDAVENKYRQCADSDIPSALIQEHPAIARIRSVKASRYNSSSLTEDIAFAAALLADPAVAWALENYDGDEYEEGIAGICRILSELAAGRGLVNDELVEALQEYDALKAPAQVSEPIAEFTASQGGLHPEPEAIQAVRRWLSVGRPATSAEQDYEFGVALLRDADVRDAVLTGEHDTNSIRYLMNEVLLQHIISRGEATAALKEYDAIKGVESPQDEARALRSEIVRLAEEIEEHTSAVRANRRQDDARESGLLQSRAAAEARLEVLRTS